MSKIKLWFNSWFSTAYNIIDLIKNNNEGTEFEIFVSHSNRYSLNLQIADNAFIEPKLSDEDYLNYCLDKCREYDIDIFIPYYKSFLISKNISKFHALGIKVLVCEDVKLLELIDNKVLFYDDINPKNIIKIPEYYMVSTRQELIKAYNKLKTKGRVCFKPVSGVGGAGFRIIKESSDSIDSILSSTPSYSINFNNLLELLPKEESFKSIIIMEYLEGYEYSIDCLADKKGKLITAVPRKKIDGYNRYLENNQELIRFAEEISEIYKIPYVYNIQVRYKNDEFNLLEINTRMSGGVHYSCMAGINIPYEAIKVLLDKKVDIPNLNLDIMIGNINKAIVNNLIK